MELAVRALLKIHPLAYAASRPTGAQQDIAALPRVRPEDRDRLAEALDAALNRRPQVVREALATLTAAIRQP